MDDSSIAIATSAVSLGIAGIAALISWRAYKVSRHADLPAVEIFVMSFHTGLTGIAYRMAEEDKSTWTIVSIRQRWRPFDAPRLMDLGLEYKDRAPGKILD